MVATFQEMGVSRERVEAMLLGQAEQKRAFIDLLADRLKTPPPTSFIERCQGRLLGKEAAAELHAFLLGSSAARSMRGCTVLHDCERKSCKHALSSDGLRQQVATYMCHVAHMHITCTHAHMHTCTCTCTCTCTHGKHALLLRTPSTGRWRLGDRPHSHSEPAQYT